MYAYTYINIYIHVYIYIYVAGPPLLPPSPAIPKAETKKEDDAAGAKPKGTPKSKPKSKPVENPLLRDIKMSGPTNEDNPRVELVAKDCKSGKKVHVMTVNRKRHGKKFSAAAKKVKVHFGSEEKFFRSDAVQMMEEFLA